MKFTLKIKFRIKASQMYTFMCGKLHFMLVLMFVKMATAAGLSDCDTELTGGII